MTLDDETMEKIARVVHEANRAWCRAHGDESQPAYDEAEPWMCDATAEGIKFRLEHPDAPASAQHDQWMAEKINAGWTWGPEKNAEAKTHPMLIPYDELPAFEKKKDALFSAIVTALT